MLSNQLKEKTSVAHQQLEKIIIKRLKEIRSETDYANLLSHFYVYFGTVEKAVEPFINNTIIPDITARRKAKLLHADIEALAQSKIEYPTAVAPQLNSIAAALGALYVMEGSVMGGPIIVNMLQKAGINKGLSFFSGYGSKNGTMWSQFLHRLNEQVKDETAQKEAIDAANQTFQLFAQTFTN